MPRTTPTETEEKLNTEEDIITLTRSVKQASPDYQEALDAHRQTFNPKTIPEKKLGEVSPITTTSQSEQPTDTASDTFSTEKSSSSTDSLSAEDKKEARRAAEIDHDEKGLIFLNRTDTQQFCVGSTIAKIAKETSGKAPNSSTAEAQRSTTPQNFPNPVRWPIFRDLLAALTPHANSSSL